MKIIRIFNTQPVKMPHFKSLLTGKQARDPFFIAFFQWSYHELCQVSKKCLLVDQFQGNYLKMNHYKINELLRALSLVDKCM